MGLQSKINKLIGRAGTIAENCCGKNYILTQIITEGSDDEPDEDNFILDSDSNPITDDADLPLIDT